MSFRPHPLLPTGDLQTLATRFFSPVPPASERLVFAVGAGDAVVGMLSLPPAFRAGDPVVVLVHGMTGSSQSAYVVRMAHQVMASGAAALRLNLRNAGEGAGLSRLPYHSGRSDDLRKVLQSLAARFPGSPLAVIGYSLGGNITLKLAAEHTDAPVEGLRAVASVAAPIDLALCSRALEQWRNRIYQFYFVRGLMAEAHGLARALGEPPVPFPREMTVWKFDDHFTAPRSGFTDAAAYYAASSSGPRLRAVTLPTLLVTAQDDPFVPFAAYRDAQLSPSITPRYARSGGHCGFIAADSTRRFWAEAECVAFVMGNTRE